MKLSLRKRVGVLSLAVSAALVGMALRSGEAWAENPGDGDTVTPGQPWVSIVETVNPVAMPLDDPADKSGVLVTPESPEGQELMTLAVLARDIVDEHPDNFAGLFLAWDRGTVVVRVVDKAGPGVDDVLALGDGHAGVKTELRVVPKSEEDLLHAQDSLFAGEAAALLGPAFQPSTVYADWDTGRLRVQFDDSEVSIAQGPALRAKGGQLSMNLDEVAKFLDVGMDVAVEPGLKLTATGGTRANNTAPFSGQGVANSLSGGSGCTLGMPNLAIGTTRLISLAGHCSFRDEVVGLKTFVSGTGSTIGTRYGHNAFATNPETQGDWQLLSGSSYQLNTFTIHGTTDTTQLTGADFAAASDNASLCTGGRNTNWLCRYRIATRHTSTTIGFKDMYGNEFARRIGRLTVTTRDPDWDVTTPSTCYGFIPGDSGGLAVYADPIRPKNVWGYGMNEATDSNVVGPTGCIYVFQEFNGMRAAYPGITAVN